jgi:diguanylate cyclase (GGDEF)-like protein/PAS domain S-box-containing protein
MHNSTPEIDFEKIFELFSIPLFIHDELGYLKYANRQCLNLLGKDLKSSLNHKVDQFFPKRKKSFSGYSEASMTEIMILHDVFVLRKFPLHGIKGQQLTCCSLENITHLEEAHKQAKKLAFKLDEKEEDIKKYYNIFESSKDAIMLLSNHIFLECNKATLKMFACRSREDFLLHRPSDFSPEFQEKGIPSKELEIQYMKEALEKGKVIFEWTHKKITGETFPAEVLLSSFQSQGKTLLQATIRDISEVKKLHAELLLMSAEDALTKLNNRRHMDHMLQKEFERSQRTDEVFSLIMIDIDRFKEINDCFGHPAGDLVLQDLAAHLKHNLRKIDIKTRIGGEEFLIILPNTNKKKAHLCAEKIRKAVAEASKKSNKVVPYTISAGITEFKTTIKDKEVLLNQVDAALYQAKNSGRNKTIVFS